MKVVSFICWLPRTLLFYARLGDHDELSFVNGTVQNNVVATGFTPARRDYDQCMPE